MVGKLMDHSPRIPSFIGLNVIQVTFVAPYIVVGWGLYVYIVSNFFFILLVSGSCSVVICNYDYSCTYCFSHFCIIHSSPSLVSCTCFGRGYREAMWSSIGGSYGAGLGCTGSPPCASMIASYIYCFLYTAFSNLMFSFFCS